MVFELRSGRITFTLRDYGNGFMVPDPPTAEFAGPTHPTVLLFAASVALYLVSVIERILHRWRNPRANSR
jgi:hypothetical protein